VFVPRDIPGGHLNNTLGCVFLSGVVPLCSITGTIPPVLGLRAQIRACVHNVWKTLEATSASRYDMCKAVAYLVDEDHIPVAKDELATFLQAR